MSLSKQQIAPVSILLYLFVGPSLILINRKLLKGDFPYPMLIASLGLVFSFIITAGLYLTRIVSVPKAVTMNQDYFFRRVVPIGVCQALTFQFGTTAYLHLPTSFIQMMKSISPATIAVALALSGKPPSRISEVCGLCIIISGSVATLQGLGQPSTMGLFLIAAAEVAECIRVVMTQILLQDEKFSLWESLFFIAPTAATFLLIGSSISEAQSIVSIVTVDMILGNFHLLLLSGLFGFGVNTISFLVIQNYSGVMLKALGTLRNSGLVLFCALLLSENITSTQLSGYAVSITGFAMYTYSVNT